MVVGDAVQVAAAIVEITDTLPVGTDGFGTVAQCIIAAMPDVTSGSAVQTVVTVFSDKVAEFVVEVLVAATLVHYAKGRLKTRYDFRRPFYYALYNKKCRRLYHLRHF